MLAVKILQEQDIEVVGVNFVSNFFDSRVAERSARHLGLELKILDISEELLEMIKKPDHGRGKNLNPCLDCHGFMIRKAKQELLSGSPKDCFIATGEVLGQRPFSQTKNALKKVEELAGSEVLRPLSAKLLPVTEIEKQGLVDREKLLDIKGRSREGQMKLASEHGIKDYPSPSGGCLLTDPGFSQRLKDMMDKWAVFKPADVELLKQGRVFWANQADQNWVLVVVSRDEREGESLMKLKRSGDVLVQLKDMTGPLILARGLNLDQEKKEWEFNCYIPDKWPADLLSLPERGEQILSTLALMAGYYKPEARGKELKVGLRRD